MRFLIVYGPTQEPLDPVRFLSNSSTGTMGRYLVRAARKAKHKVTTVECPKDARSAKDLLKLLKRLTPKQDVLVMAAAVCDARPAHYSAEKIKKEKLNSVKLVKNPDILLELSKKKKKGQIFVGFAVESENYLKNAAQKLKNKKLELLVLQKIVKNNLPFGDKKVDAVFLTQKDRLKSFKSASKAEIARQIIRVTETALFDRL